MVRKTTPASLAPLAIGFKIGSMFRCLIALTALLSTAAVAATAWTWVDQQGRRHYSDTPVDGATRIELRDSQTFTAPVSAQPRPAQATAAEADTGAESPSPAPPAYTTFDIVSPSNEETLWNLGGTLTVQLALYPALDPSHRIDVVLDGEYRELGARTLTVTIPDVFRGEHTVRAVVVDADGTQLKRSSQVTVFVQQTSIQNPNRDAPNRPNPVIPLN